MKKAVSPLISYIMLIGMVVAMSAIVANYLINQARDINFDSQENAVYCTDVAMDAIIEKCDIPELKVLYLNITNRGYYSISNLAIIRKGTNTKNLIAGEEYNYTLYVNDIEDEFQSLVPIPPGRKALLKLVLKENVVLESIIKNITITPTININNKNSICNEKLFKLTIDTNICP